MPIQNYVLLERIELTSASAASVTFSSIPQTGYQGLKIVASVNNTGAGSDDLRIRLNGDTSATYSMKAVLGSGSAVTNATESGQTSSWLGNINPTGVIFNTVEINIPNYKSTSAKQFFTDNFGEANASAATARLISNTWNPGSNGPITSITLFPNANSLARYSTFSLYGLAAANVTPSNAPKASGGNIISTDGTYWYHAFLASGTFTPQLALSADVLVVAGGGGSGGYNGAGGGGAGGLSYQAARSLATTGYTVTIGAGGAGTSTAITGNSGSNSVFDTITSLGGGGGGCALVNTPSTGQGANGGSSGGGAYNSTVASSATQGNSGGATGYGFGTQAGTNSATGQPAAGGGGAGSIGLRGTTNQGGNGGSGLNTWSTWASATGTGVGGYYAGGGGGGIITAGTVGAGGAGGGGTGGRFQTPRLDCTSGTANTGGGGGGQGEGSVALGSGGSGIVIVRYAV